MLLKQQERLVALIAADESAMVALRAARTLGLPDWAVGAGFVRNRVWDALTGRRTARPTDDVDVVYFDPSDPEGLREYDAEPRLRALLPGVPVEVRNQVRMAKRNGDPPYRSTEDAMRYWLETPTAIGVRLEADDSMTVLAPHGLDDLFGLVLRPTPRGRERRAAFDARVVSKKWLERWPEARLLD